MKSTWKAALSELHAAGALADVSFDCVCGEALRYSDDVAVVCVDGELFLIHEECIAFVSFQFNRMEH